jgi:hypothetical protein
LHNIANMKNNFLLLLVLLVTVAASLGIMKSGSTVKGLGISPEIVSFTATPAVVRPGEPVTLAWETRGTVSVAMEWGPENSSRAELHLLAGLPS